ncbi:MAG: response regulator [Lachnospiraceae bacterium]|nr:response regulator [Lachnospiraceae bacterium]
MYRLLVVDDERDIRENIRYLLDWSRYRINHIETAATYGEAVNKALDFRPHIILMDVNLGEGRWGYELLERLRASGLKVACGMISGYDDFTYMKKSMQASARDYLLKPIDVKELERFVERVIVEELKGELPEKKSDAPDVDPVLKVEYGKLSRITNKIIMIVKSDYKSSLSLVDIGEMFCMSSKYIGRIFLQDTGMKFSEYLMAYRMVQARMLIETTGDKIAVVAGRVGYPQLNNFYVHFKEYYGISPTALRDVEEKANAPDRGSMLRRDGKEQPGAGEGREIHEGA